MLTTSSSPTSVAASPKSTYVELKACPPLLHFEYKKEQYKITFIKQRQGTEGQKTEVDLSTITPEQEKAFIEEAKKVMEAMEKGLPDLSKLKATGSFTLHFTQNAPIDRPFASLLGRVIPKFAIPKQQPVILNHVSYKETGDSQEKTIHIAKELRKKPEAYEEIHQALQPLSKLITRIANEDDEEVEPPKPVKTKSKTSTQAAASKVKNNNNGLLADPESLPVNKKSEQHDIPFEDLEESKIEEIT